MKSSHARMCLALSYSRLHSLQIKLPPGDEAVQRLVDNSTFQEWTEANGLRMCGYFQREVGGEEVQTDGCNVERVRVLSF